MHNKYLRRRIATSAFLATLTVFSAQPNSSEPTSETDRTISVGQPKIWRYERVYPLLDGMLRDIEAALVQHLPLMDPNQANQTYLDFLRTLISVQANYNQGAGVKNQLELSRAQQSANEQQLDHDYRNTLREERATTEKQLLAAEKLQSEAQQKAAAAQEGSTEKTDAQKEADRQTQIVNDLQARKKQLDTDIGTPDKTGPSFTDALSGDTARTQPSSLPPFLDTVPDSVKTKLWENAGKANLPATKQFENYVTLLNERMAKQLLVIADDASRNGYELFMMQFDVGLYPSGKTKNRVARVEFEMDSESSDAKPYAYGLIPGNSAYNIQEYIGRSKNLSIIGLFNLLSGLGVRGEYQRQRDQFRSGLVQTVYTSGFENGRTSFGWYHGPAPFEAFVTPGLRTTYALVAVPYCTPKLKFTIHKGWQSKSGDLSSDSKNASSSYEVDVPTYVAGCSKSTGNPRGFDQTVIRVAYQTKLNSPSAVSSPTTPAGASPASSSGAPATAPAPTTAPAPVNAQHDIPNDDTNTIAIALKNPADANMTVTVGSKLLKRVRDSRGQAVLSPTVSSAPSQNPPEGGSPPSAQQPNNPLVPPRGEFEVDRFDRDTWILSNSRTLLLNISKTTAGNGFPVIRLSDSSSEAVDITADLLDPNAGVEIDNWKFKPPIPRSAFVPLFLREECRVDQYLSVSLEAIGSPNKVRVAFRSPEQEGECAHDRHLSESTQVVLDMGASVGQWALSCKQLGNDLICDVPKQACAENLHCLTDQLISVYDAKTGIAASARFVSPEVLPHFDNTTGTITYDPKTQAWTVVYSAIHLTAQDNRIREFANCQPQPSVIPHPEENTLEVVISALAYRDCLPHEGSLFFHLLHHVETRSAFFSGGQSGDVPIEVPNSAWSIRTTTSLGLTVSNWDKLFYALTEPTNGGWFHPDSIDSVTATNGIDEDQRLRIRHVPNALLFEITDAMSAAQTCYYLQLGVGAASFTYGDNSGVPIRYSFQKQKKCDTPDAPK